ncbi:hypothetical protein [Leptospira ryugenii]|nr:hypothetical protein [Leptospira ryugenii]
MKQFKLSIIFILGFMHLPLLADSIEFPKEESCVAYRTSKRLFLVQEQTVVGLNCKIQTKIEKSTEGFSFEGTFPISGFDSKEPSRDEHVRELLEEKDQSSLVFVSDPISQIDWNKKKGTSFELSGKLRKGNKDFKLNFRIKREIFQGKAVWTGSVKTKFTNLGMEPPSVALGAVAKVRDDLELLFHFQESQIKGFPN